MPTKKKTFFLSSEKNPPQKRCHLAWGEGGGVSGRATKKNYFFVASLTWTEIIMSYLSSQKVSHFVHISQINF